jgi:hypothetical protein
MQPHDRLAFYEERLACLWQQLVATLGIHTARVLLDRASGRRRSATPISPSSTRTVGASKLTPRR